MIPVPYGVTHCLKKIDRHFYAVSRRDVNMNSVKDAAIDERTTINSIRRYNGLFSLSLAQLLQFISMSLTHHILTQSE